MFAPPSPGENHADDPVRLADWVELNLLMEEEPFVSVTSVADELASIPPDDARDSEERSVYEDPDSPENGQIREGYRDAAEQQVEAAFRELSGRENWLSKHYPVEIDGEVAQLRQERPARDIYRFLILLRSRQLYHGALEDDGEEAGRLFEELVKCALGAYCGSGPHHLARFGNAGGYRGDGLPKSLAKAVRELSRRMCEKPGQVSCSQQGDFKADAVAWKPFGDGRPGQLVLICQATISEGDWLRKEPAIRWTDRQPPDSRLILFFARPITAVAFPETLSLTPPDVLAGLPFSSIPFDRLRLLSVLLDDDLPCDLRDSIRDWTHEMQGRLPAW